MKRAQNLDIPQTLAELCDPKRMALVVHDMQIGILTQIKNPQAVLANVSRVLEAARAAGVRTFFMRHMSLPKELMGAFSYRMAMDWQRTDDPEKVNPWFLRGSPGFAITPELAPRQSEAIFDKLTMSEAGQRSIEALKFAGDAVFTDMAAFCSALQRQETFNVRS